MGQIVQAGAIAQLLQVTTQELTELAEGPSGEGAVPVVNGVRTIVIVIISQLMLFFDLITIVIRTHDRYIYIYIHIYIYIQSHRGYYLII